MRTTPRAYGNVVYLDGLWDQPRTPHDDDELKLIHRRLDEHRPNALWALPAISEGDFQSATHQTQRFIVHTEMNDCVHQEVDAIPDLKPKHLAARCRSF